MNKKVRISFLFLCTAFIIWMLFKHLHKGKETLQSSSILDSQISESSFASKSEEHFEPASSGIMKPFGDSRNDGATGDPIRSPSDLDPEMLEKFKEITIRYNDLLIQLELKHAEVIESSPSYFEITIPPVFEKGGSDIESRLLKELEVFGDVNINLLYESVKGQLSAIQGSNDFGRTQRRIYLSRDVESQASSLVDFQVESKGSTVMGALPSAVLPKTIKPFYHLAFSN